MVTVVFFKRHAESVDSGRLMGVGGLTHTIRLALCQYSHGVPFGYLQQEQHCFLSDEAPEVDIVHLQGCRGMRSAGVQLCMTPGI